MSMQLYKMIFILSVVGIYAKVHALLRDLGRTPGKFVSPLRLQRGKILTGFLYSLHWRSEFHCKMCTASVDCSSPKCDLRTATSAYICFTNCFGSEFTKTTDRRFKLFIGKIGRKKCMLSIYGLALICT